MALGWDDSISSIRCWRGCGMDSFCQRNSGWFCTAMSVFVEVSYDVGIYFGIAIRLVPSASFASSLAAALPPAGTLFLPRQFVTLAFGVKLSLWRNALQFLST